MKETKEQMKRRIYNSIMEKIEPVVRRRILESRSIEVYTFDELSPEAQKKALKSVNQIACDRYTETDWDDAFDTLHRLFDISGVTMEIQSNSQGPYTRSIRWDNPLDMTDREAFRKFMKDMSNFKVMLWCDEDMKEIALNAELEPDRYCKSEPNTGDYARTIESIALRFWTKIYNITCDYIDNDEITIEYIKGNDDLEFHEDGTPYRK